MSTDILLILFCLGLVAFFAGSETAFISLNRVRLRYLAEARRRSAVLLMRMLERPDRFLGSTLVGQNLAVVGASAIATKLLMNVFTHRAELVCTLSLTPLILIFCELIPKAVFRQNANRIMMIFAYPLETLFRLFSPIVYVVNAFAHTILFLAGQKDKKTRSLFVTREELKFLIEESEREGVLMPHERQIIYNIFDFGAIRVKQIMKPIEKVASITQETTIGELKERARQSGYTRLPVVEDSEVLGIVNVLDVVFERDEEKHLRQFVRPCPFILQDVVVDKVLLMLQSQRQVMAVLTDSRNSPVGIVTIEDIVRALVERPTS